MARVNVPVTVISRSGVAPPAQTNADSANGHYISLNDGTVWIEIVSSDAGAQTVAFKLPGLVDGQALADKVVSVAAGATAIAGPFPISSYNQSDGSLWFNPSVSTTLKFRAYKFGP